MNTIVPLIADAAGWHHGGCWIVFPILWLLLAALVIAFFWRRGRGSHDGGELAPGSSASVSRGEISADEYRDRLSQLQSIDERNHEPL